jgi:HEPN domain-containing protein
LNRARSNLSRAKSRIPEVYLEDLCFDAQQAAEKAVKALLVKKGVAFPYVHDIAHLLSLAEQTGVQLPETVRRAEDLTRYAVVTRYPGLAEPVTESHYRDAIVSAEAVVRWAEKEIG